MNVSYYNLNNTILTACLFDLALCTDGAIRFLPEGLLPSSGYIEVCVNRTWGRVCRDFWDNSDASVVCTQLGYSPYGNITIHFIYWYQDRALY